MKQTITIIPLENLILCFIPVIILIFIFFKWKQNWKGLAYATLRMVSQLLIIGYFLTYIFKQNNMFYTLLIVSFMLVIASWISLYSIKEYRRKYLKYSLLSLVICAVPVLLLVTTVVIPTSPWYTPSFLIPLSGMVLSQSMNTIGLASERYIEEYSTGHIKNARYAALKAALIPLTNSFMAVGLVSLPGMMTGQILSGISPLIAVRYQIVVMTMIMGAGGLSASLFLFLISKLQNPAETS